MADIGIDFRTGSGFVTDPAGCTYCTEGDSYPTTRGGRTFGWGSTPSGRDRNAGIDARIAGINFAAAAASHTFRLDGCDTGANDIYLAVGDDLYATLTTATVTLKDGVGGSTLFSISPIISGSNKFADANDIDYTSAGWIAASTYGGTVRAVTLTGTVLTLVLDGGISFGAIAHLRIMSNGGGGSSIKTMNGLAKASIKTVNGLAIASMKSRNGLT